MSKDHINLSSNINNLSTIAILRHVAYRHRVFLLVLALVTSWALFLVHSAPMALEQLTH